MNQPDTMWDKHSLGIMLNNIIYNLKMGIVINNIIILDGAIG